jgi:hypothetical protein
MTCGNPMGDDLSIESGDWSHPWETESRISCNMSCQSPFLPATFKIWTSTTIAETVLSFPLQLLAHVIQSSPPLYFVQYHGATSLSSTSAYIACLLRIQWLMYIVNVSKSWYKNGWWKSRTDPLDNAAQSTAHLSWTGSILWFYSNAYLLLCIDHAICRVGIYDVPCSELRVHVGGWLCRGTNGLGRGRRGAGPLE